MSRLADLALLDRMERFCGPNIGLIHEIEHVQRFKSFYVPGLQYVRARSCNLRLLGGAFREGFLGFGQDLDLVPATIRCLGETIERSYNSFLPETTPVLWQSYDSLKASHPRELLELEDYQLIRSEQETNGAKRMAPDDLLHWVYMKSLGENGSGPERMFFPLFSVGLSDHHTLPYDAGTSNGVGLGSTLENALLSATLESVERDCLMRLWWLRQIPSRLSVDRLLPFLSDCSSQFIQHLRAQVHFIDCTSIWSVPVIACVVAGRGENQPTYYLGAGSGLSWVNALERCVQEMARVWIHLGTDRKNGHLNKIPVAPYEKSIQNFIDLHPLLFDRALLEQHAGFLVKQAAPKVDPSPERNLADFQTLRRTLLHQGLRLFYFDFTPDFLAQEGFHVVKVRSPDLIQLNCAHQFRPWGCPALARVPEKMLNPFPQIFL